MNKLSVLTGFLVIILSLALKAQQPQGIPDINTATIPSPDAVTFDKLITQQVDLYTGKPNVEIPLFIAKSRKLTLPIKLVYNNSGLVVTDHSSWAGYGWSLIAGGQVSRQVRGLKDETPDIGYFALAHYLPSDPLQLNKNPNYFTAGQQRRIANQTWDLEPDIYNYSFQGYSGQFIIYVDSLGNKTIYPDQFIKSNTILLNA
ncbi:MAG: hypothetical protein NTY96_11405 [Bacteroidetes bacterium]|nr:hypothetical protein [Bacteroidota bacterium]